MSLYKDGNLTRVIYSSNNLKFKLSILEGQILLMFHRITITHQTISQYLEAVFFLVWHQNGSNVCLIAAE